MNRRKFLGLLSKGAALVGIAPLVRIPELQPNPYRELGEAIGSGVADGIEPLSEAHCLRECDEYLFSERPEVGIAWNGKGEEWRKHPGGEWEKTRDERLVIVRYSGYGWERIRWSKLKTRDHWLDG